MGRALRTIRLLLRLGAGLLPLGCVTSAGCNDCDFTKRCNGDVLEQCGGTDQVIGRGVVRTPCVGLNPRCVETADKQAFCATAKDQPCTAADRRCEGTKLITCTSGFEVATDCALITDSVANPGGVPTKYVCSAALPDFPADCHKNVE